MAKSDNNNDMSCNISDWMTKSEYDKVIFQDVAESYPTDADVRCRYSLTESVTPTDGDLIALFKVGWEAPHLFVKSERAVVPDKADESTELSIVFKAENLPKDDGFYYQFCYLSADGIVRGASTPFRFRHPLTEELVEIEDADSDLLIIRTRTAVIEEKLQEVADKNNELIKFKAALEKELKEKCQRYNELEKHLSVYKIDIKNLREELETTNATQIDAINQLKQELEVTIMKATNDTATFHSQMIQNDAYIEELRSTIKLLSEQKAMTDAVLTNDKKERETLEKRVETLEFHLNSIMDKNKRLVQELSMEEEKVAALQEQIVNLEAQLHIEQNKYAELKKKTTILEQEKDQLASELLDTEHMLSAMERSKYLATEELIASTKFKDKLTEELEETQVQLQDLQDHYLQREVEKKQSIQQKDQVVKEYEDLQQKYKDLQEKHDTFANIENQWLADKASLSGIIDDLRNRLNTGAIVYQTKYIECLKLEKKLGKLKKKYKERFLSESSNPNSSARTCSETSDENQDVRMAEEKTGATCEDASLEMITSLLQQKFDVVLEKFKEQFPGSCQQVVDPKNQHYFPPPPPTTLSFRHHQGMANNPFFQEISLENQVNLPQLHKSDSPSARQNCGNLLPPPMQPEITALAKLAAVTAVSKHLTEATPPLHVESKCPEPEELPSIGNRDVETDGPSTVVNIPLINSDLPSIPTADNILQIEKCPICDFPFDDMDMLANHVEEHFGRDCPVCHETYGRHDQAALEAHVHSHFENDSFHQRYDLNFD